MVTDRDSLDRDGWIDDKPDLAPPRCRPIVWLAAALALWAVIAALIMGLLSFVPGCGGATTRIHAPTAKATVTDSTTHKDGTTTTHTETVETAGPSGVSSGAQEQIRIEGTAPSVTTPGGISAAGGMTRSDGSAKIAQGAAGRWTAGIIGLLIVGFGGWGLYSLQPLKSSLGTIGIGAALIASALWISLALYILAGVAVYAAGSLWLTGLDAARFREALRALAAGVSDMASKHPAAHQDLTDRDGLLAAHADSRDLKTIEKVATKDKLDVPT